MPRITEIVAELAEEAHDDDLIHIVDVSDPTDNVAGSSKRHRMEHIVSKARNINSGEAIDLNGRGEITVDGTHMYIDFNNVTAGGSLYIRDNTDAVLFRFENDGSAIILDDVSMTNGNLNLNNGNLIVQSGNLIITLGNVVIGNLSIEAANDSIDLAAASTLSIRNSVNANLLTIDESSGNVGIPSGNLNMNNNPITNVAGITSTNAIFISTNNASAGVSMTGGGTNTYFFVGVSTFDMGDSVMNNLNSVQYRSGPADPTPADIPTGCTSNWYNTTATEMRTWANVGGVMLSSAAFT